ncbi:MAG: thioredoxin-related protein [Paraglaciecola sp.]|jgi:thioredoxin-related protein
MNKYFIAIIAAVILVPSLYAAISPNFYSAEVDWHHYKEARAMDSEKPIFVFAKMRFCTTCAAMEKDIFTDPTLAKILNERFIPVKETINFLLSSFVFDDLQDGEGEQLAFRGFPAVMIVKGDNYTLSHGYKNVEQLLVILDKALALK